MIRYGLIGCGRIAPNHIAAARQSNMEIVALCDTDIMKANYLVQRFTLKNVHIYSNYIEMIQNESLNVVAIATPSGMHAKIAIDCCNKRINTIIEKPMALSTTDAQKVENMAKENEVKVTVCHQNRYNTAVQFAMETINQGRIGKVLSISTNVLWSRNREYYTQALWRGTWKQDGGVLMNQGIHSIDLLQWFAGSKVQCVSAFIDNIAHPYIEVEDIGVAIIKFTNGCVGSINCTSNVYNKNMEETLYIIGEKGTIKLGGKSVNSIDYLDIEGEDNTEDLIKNNSCIPPNIYGYGHTPLYMNFADAIQYDKDPYIDISDARKAVELVFCIYKSAIEKRIVYCPIGKFTTDDMGAYNYGF